MAKYTYVNGNLSALADILEDSGYFDTVSYSEDTGTSTTSYAITCTINGTTVFWYQGRYSSSAINQHFNIKVYGVTPSFASNVNSSSTQWSYFPTAVYECNGGIAIVCTYGRIVITKNQRGETMIVFNSTYDGTSLAGNMATIGAIAYTDSGTFYNFKMNTNLGNQTQLIPICSCSGFDEKSYTETALVSTYKQYSSIGFIVYNNKRYFYDGYFAIEDEMVEE